MAFLLLHNYTDFIINKDDFITLSYLSKIINIINET